MSEILSSETNRIAVNDDKITELYYSELLQDPEYIEYLRKTPVGYWDTQDEDYWG